MRNLKKVLSLALALVMLLGMMVVGAGAVTLGDYSDKAGINENYLEAVDLLTAIDVLSGSQNTFDPSGTLTREQAAKIVATLALGVDAASALSTAVAPFSDVAANWWSAGYVAYCANMGIVSGIGGGKFAPAGEVSGYQFAKMLLGVLGFGENDEYVGPNWVLNVSRDAVTVGVSKSVQISDAPLTREEAAQMAYNTIQLPLVSYSSLVGTYTEYAWNNGAQTLLGNLATNIFKVTKASEDDLYTYTYEYWHYLNNATPITGSYLTDVVLGTESSITWGGLYRGYGWNKNVTVVENGQNPAYVSSGTGETATYRVALGEGTVASDRYGAIDPVDLRGDSTKKAIDYNGQVIVLLDTCGEPRYNSTTGRWEGTDKDGLVDTIFVVTAYLAEVTKVNAATASDPRNVTVRAYVPSELNHVAYVTANIETEDYAVGDKLLVDPQMTLAQVKSTSHNLTGTPSAAEISAAQTKRLVSAFSDPCGFRTAESFTSSVTAYYLNAENRANGSVTTNGARYNYNGVYMDSSAVGYIYTVDPGYTLNSASYQFYLDDVGNVIGVEVVQDSISDYVYVIAVGENELERSNIIWGLTNDGTIKRYEVSDKSDTGLFDKTSRTLTYDAGSGKYTETGMGDGLRNPLDGVGVIYNYAIDANGEIILRRLSDRYTSIYGAAIPTNGFKKGLSSLSYVTGDTAYAPNGTSSNTQKGVVYANNATVVLFYDKENNTVTRFEGYTNIPDLSEIADGKVAIATQAIGNNTYANMVVIDKAYEAAAKDWVYIVGNEGRTGGGSSNGKYYFWNVIMKDADGNGIYTVIANTKNDVSSDQVWNYTVDQDGYAGDSNNYAIAGLYTTKTQSSVVRGTVAVNPVGNTLVVQFDDHSSKEYVLAENAVTADVSEYSIDPNNRALVKLGVVAEPGDKVTLIVDKDKIEAMFITGLDQAYISEFDWSVNYSGNGKLAKVETAIKDGFGSGWAFNLYTRNNAYSMTVGELKAATKLTNTNASMEVYYAADPADGYTAAVNATAANRLLDVTPLQNGETYFIRVTYGTAYNVFEVTFNGKSSSAGNSLTVGGNGTPNVAPSETVVTSGDGYAQAIVGKDIDDVSDDLTEGSDLAKIRDALGLADGTGDEPAAPADQVKAIAKSNMLFAGFTKYASAATTLKIYATNGTVVYEESYTPASNGTGVFNVTLDYKESLGAAKDSALPEYWDVEVSTTWGDQSTYHGLKAGTYAWEVTAAGHGVVGSGSFIITRP